MRFLIKKSDAEKNQIKLSVKDKKLIQLLVQDGRMSVSELAKKIQISKPAVTQKINSLKEKKVLLDPVLYTNLNLEPLYFLQISTGIGYDTEKNDKELLNIKGILAILWYNSPYNLLLGISHDDVQEVIENIERVIEIKKIRILKVSNSWFHPPHIFSEIPNVKTGFRISNPEVDETDRRILKQLEENPRATILNISERIKSAPINIKRRIEKMQKSGAIIHISNYVNMWLCGKDLVSVHFQVKGRKNLNAIVSKLLSFPQTGNVWELEHEWNLNVVFWVSNHLEVSRILDSISKECKGILDSDIMVLTSMVGK